MNYFGPTGLAKDDLEKKNGTQSNEQIRAG